MKLRHCTGWLLCVVSSGTCLLAAILVSPPTWGGVLGFIVHPLIPVAVWTVGALGIALCQWSAVLPRSCEHLLIAVGAWTLWVVLANGARSAPVLWAYLGGESEFFWIGVLSFTGLLALWVYATPRLRESTRE